MKLRRARNLVAVAASALAAVSVTPASAEVIGFEDISFPGWGTELSSPYHGLNWSGGRGAESWIISNQGFPPPEAHSGNNFAWSNGGTDLYLSAVSGTFDFNSFWARYACSPCYAATAHGFLGNAEVYTQNFVATRQEYALFTFNFVGIDRATFTFNTHGDGGNLLIDDVAINVAAVPEPETYAMLLAGLCMLGLFARRTNRRRSLGMGLVSWRSCSGASRLLLRAGAPLRARPTLPELVLIVWLDGEYQ